MNKSLTNPKEITSNVPQFSTRLAVSAEDTLAAQSLRYRVFVEELGADGPLVDHVAQLERDAFDEHAEQLLLLDGARAEGDQVVGVYRLMDDTAAQLAGRYYSADEFDLTPLTGSGRRLMELGRSCLHPEYRGTAGVIHLWQGLADIVRARQIDVLFGVASFHGTDIANLAPSLSLLYRDHLAPEDIRVRSQDYQAMDIGPVANRMAAMRNVPSLIKAYLRLGGFVGDGAFVDHAFNTTDVCLVLDLARMNPRQAALYGGLR